MIFVFDGVMGSSLPPKRQLREPIRGANVFRLPPTGHDSVRVMSLVRGSPFDSVRLRQTHCPCPGVKGSQVRILSSRPIRGPLMLVKTPRQRAFFMFGVDLVGLGTVRSWEPFGDQPVFRKAVSESPAAAIEVASGCR